MLSPQEAIQAGKFSLDQAVSQAQQNAQSLDLLRSGINGLLNENNDLRTKAVEAEKKIKDLEEKNKSLLKSNNAVTEKAAE